VTAIATLAAELERKDRLITSILGELHEAHARLAAADRRHERDTELLRQYRDLLEMPVSQAREQVAA